MKDKVPVRPAEHWGYAVFLWSEKQSFATCCQATQQYQSCATARWIVLLLGRLEWNLVESPPAIGWLVSPISECTCVRFRVTLVLMRRSQVRVNMMGCAQLKVQGVEICRHAVADHVFHILAFSGVRLGPTSNDTSHSSINVVKTPKCDS